MSRAAFRQGPRNKTRPLGNSDRTVPKDQKDPALRAKNVGVRLRKRYGGVVITGPLVVFSLRGVAGTWRNFPFAIYFAALGAGFILAMSGLIQRYVLFLGHQGYAFPVVIGGLLLSAGLGSMLAGAFRKRPHVVMLTAALVICAALTGIQFFLDDIFSQTADLEMLPRIGVALLVLVPLGVPLGMMFPTGLNVVKQTSPLFVPCIQR